MAAAERNEAQTAAFSWTPVVSGQSRDVLEHRANERREPRRREAEGLRQPPCKAWAGLETEEVHGDDGGGGGFLGKV